MEQSVVFSETNLANCKTLCEGQSVLCNEIKRIIDKSGREKRQELLIEERRDLDFPFSESLEVQ